MVKRPRVNENRKSNVESCKDYNQKKKLNDGNFEETEIIRVNIYRAKKKINLRQKKLLSVKKIALKNQYIQILKIAPVNSKYNMEAETHKYCKFIQDSTILGKSHFTSI